jgi:putative metallohydrolase (TIGR04338 family)
MPADALYAAEDQWSSALDRGGVVDFYGSRIDLPVQKRFGDLVAVQRYADAVLTQPEIHAAYPAAGPVCVRERAGQRKAHYEPEGAVIAIPMGERWAARESVVLHEVAHHCACSVDATNGVRHGVLFRSTMLTLVAATLGEAAALLLRAGYDAAPVRG